MVFVMKLSNFHHTQHLIMGDELLILGGVHDIKTGTCIAILFYKIAKFSHWICLSPGALYYHVILISIYHVKYITCFLTVPEMSLTYFNRNFSFLAAGLFCFIKLHKNNKTMVGCQYFWVS